MDVEGIRIPHMPAVIPYGCRQVFEAAELVWNPTMKHLSSAL